MRARLSIFLLGLCLWGLGLWIVATPAVAAPPAPAAGALPFSELAILAHQDLTTEINLEGPFLKLIANATASDDPEFSRLISGLQAILVRIAPVKGDDAAKVRARMDQTVRWLDSHGWSAIVKAREKGDESYIYIKQEKGEVAGLVVLSLEPGNEAAVINIVGRLDPAQIGRLGKTFHLPHLDDKRPH